MSSPKTQLAMLSDRPADQDGGLGFQPYVDTLHSIITDPHTATPLTIGVFGGWGSGKTSLMTMLRRRLEVTPHRRVAWFNAWKYHHDQALWRTLILRVLDALYPRKDGKGPWEQRERYAVDELTDDGQKEQVRLLDRLQRSLYGAVEWEDLGRWALDWRKAGKELAELPAYLLFLASGNEKLAEKLGVSPDLSQMLQQETHKQRLEQLASLEQFEATFQQALQAVLGPEGRLVVFVDDLDRCLPDKALAVLEATKLFLDAPGCVFVLGLDPVAVQAAVRTRYNDRDGEHKVDDYLEKIIQIPFRLPPVARSRMEGYLGQIAAAGLPHLLCKDVFCAGLEANPRRVKRTLNVFLLLWQLAQHDPELAEAIQPVRLAKIVVIQQYHPKLFALLIEGPHHLIDLEKRFREAEPAREASEDGVRMRGGAARAGDTESGVEVSAGPLQEFLGNGLLRSLLTCTPEGQPDLNFIDRTPGQVQEYIYLTRSAVEEQRVAAEAARLPFEPQMVTIPAGPFLMGTPEREVDELLKLLQTESKDARQGKVERETPQHELTLPAYAIARYPTTNAEFARFIEDSGYSVRDYWTAVGWAHKDREGWSEPRYWKDARYNDPSQPVVGISWYEALAYCRWLSVRTGRAYRLPSEAEWEKAARGADGRRYPWSNTWDAARCNNKESGLGRTSPVGQYPGGDSPYGVSDMVGQVWEWCSSKYGGVDDRPAFGYPYKPERGREEPEGDDTRILRGGSWADGPAWCRCACRHMDHPGHSPIRRGFRCVRTSPIF